MADFEFEKKFWDEGAKYIGGIDEAGRGPLAGPLVVACVILPQDFLFKEVNDSKKLNDKQRRELYEKILIHAIEVKIDVISSNIIDFKNIYMATKESMEYLAKNMNHKLDVVLVDAMELENINIPSVSLIKGDCTSLSIAAASIVAKVSRDNIMEVLDKKYPLYDFKNNKGYGTRKHLLALEKYGACSEHRKSFKPVRDTFNLKLDI